MFNSLLQAKDLVGIVIKIAGIIITLMYSIYSLVIIRQVQAMKKVIQFNDRGLLLMAAYLQLGLAVILLIYSLLIL